VVADSYKTFISFVSSGSGRGHGRPVDILQMADGSLLLSDDVANRIYRITYSK
jgi:glucose/arabinose dehydrogenase